MNRCKTCVMTLHAITSLHPGTGQNTGIVDLPIQREVHTGFPMIASSGLKGSLRDKAEQQWTAATDQNSIEPIFGGDTSNPGAGAIALTDGRIFAFPVRSLTHVFFWVTCPMVLKRFERDLFLIGYKNNKFKPPKINMDEVHLFPGSGLGKAESLVLEEMRLTVEYLRNELAGEFKSFFQELDEKKIAIVSDDDFQYFVKYGTQVSARIKLNDKKTTTGGDGNLWYEETLPPESLFYTLIMANDPRTSHPSEDINSAAKVMKKTISLFREGDPYLQIGGNETVGQGWCKIQIKEAP